MSTDSEQSDDLIEEGENLTQKRMGEGESRPADVSGGKESWGDTDPPPKEQTERAEEETA